MELRLGFTGIRRALDLRGFRHGLGRYRNALVIMLSALLVLGVTLALLRPAAIPDLAHGNARGFAAVSAAWARGDMIVLVRHAERCDRSSNPCLDQADGITVPGKETAAALGQDFTSLGMSRTDVLSSPATRTQQTAASMFGRAAGTQDWLADCNAGMLDAVLSHKSAGRNLLLVTHSECISRFEAQTGFKHASTRDYTSALFASIDASGQAHILGSLNADGWQRLLSLNAARH